MIGWLAGLLAITVIKDRQQGHRPDLPYGMLDLANWSPLGENVRDVLYEELETTNSEGLKEVQATPDYEIEWVFLFFVYGDGGADLMRRLHSAWRLTQIQEPINPALTVHEVSTANSVPELIKEVWEPRTQVNIVVRGVSSDGFVIDTIDTHEIGFTGERA